MATEPDVALRVLIAERHRLVAEVLGRVVGSLGSAQIAASAHDVAGALEMADRCAPDVAIVDLDLSPDCGLVTELARRHPDLRVVVLADRMERQADGLVKALASGAVGAIYREAALDDLVEAVTASSRAAPVMPSDAAGSLLGAYADAMTDKRRRDVSVIEALAAAVEARDSSTGRHLRRVRDSARACLAAIDPVLAANEEVSYGFMLHDVGKIGVPDEILRKRGPLDEREWAIMRKHPEMGVRIVDPVGFPEATIDVIRWHHERWDGRGYPDELCEEEIPLTARTFAVADAFDAMTTDRPYRRGLTRAAALGRLRDGAGTQFDPNIVDLFIAKVA